MTEIRIWAPTAERVELEPVGGPRRSMQRRPRGWFVIDAPDLVPGCDYRIALDGGEAVADPRSAWLPHGVFGPTRVLDHGSFPWTDHGWTAGPLAAGVVYELHIGTFSEPGTFVGAIEHLDHLVELGVTHVELMPIAAYSGSHGWGYDGVAWFAPHHAYGDPDDLKALVDACHARGLAVLLDVVYNHLGPEGNHLPGIGPYLVEAGATPWGAAVNLDGPHSDEVRRYIVDSATMWLREYHLDGLRLDAVHAIIDTSATHLLEELAIEVERLEAHLGRRLVLIAESDRNDPRYVRDRAAGGYGLDAQWSDDFHHALHAALTGERTSYYADFGSLADIADTLRHGYRYRGQFSEHRQRVHGRDPAGLPATRFLGYLQTHDQVGNRARGDRSAALMSFDRLRVGAALVLAAPFVPMLFQGEEWAASTPFPYFADHEDDDLAAAVRAGRLAEFEAFGWPPDAVADPEHPDTFAAAKLRWRERDAEPHRSMLRWHRSLIELRAREPDLTDGRLDQVVAVADDRVRTLALRRGAIVIVANLGEVAIDVPVLVSEPAPASASGPPAPDSDLTLLLESKPGTTVAGVGRVRVAPDAVAVVRLGPAG